MHLLETKVAHEKTGWRIDYVGDEGAKVSIRIADSHAASEVEAIQRAKDVMVQLTAYGTRGGGRSINPYDAVSNGNFDDNEPLLDTWH